jgi:GT2 family glycosyltransferase
MHLRDMRGASIVVIMLTVNQCEKTLRALASFHASTHPPFKLLLWDNGSEDGTAEAVQQAFP